MKSRLFWKGFLITAVMAISSTLFRHYKDKNDLPLSVGLIAGQLVIALLVGLAYMYFLRPRPKAD